MATQSFVQNFGGRLEAVNSMLMAVADRETDCLNRFLDLGNPVDAVKWEWVDDTLVGFHDTIKTALTSSTTTTLTVNSGTDNPKRYIDGLSLIYIEDEVLLVASTVTVVTNSTTLNVTRAQRGTTASSHAANKEIKIYSNPPNEGFTATGDHSQKGSRFYNYTQLYYRIAKLSGTSQAVSSVGQETLMNKQMAKFLPEIMKEMQGNLFHGVRYATSDTDFKDRTSGGFRYWANNGGNTEDAGGNQISTSMIDDVIEDYRRRGGDTKKLCMVASIKQQRALNDLKEARVIGNQRQSENSINNFVDNYIFGSKANVEIMYTTDLFNDEVYFFQKDLIKVKPLAANGNDRRLKRKPLPEDGDFVREMLVGEYTFEFRNVYETLYRYHNLAV